MSADASHKVAGNPQNEAYRELTCTNCNAPLMVNPSAETVTCSYCGTSYSVADLLDETEAIRLEKLRQKNEESRRSAAAAAAREAEEKRRVEQFRHGVRGKAIIVWGVLCLISMASMFVAGYPITALICAAQVVLCVLVWLMGMGILREPRQYVSLGLTILAFAAFVPMLVVYDWEDSRSYSLEYVQLGEYAWPMGELGREVPQPDSDLGVVRWEDDEGFYVVVGEIQQADFYSYTQLCMEVGFDQDYYRDNESFSADSENGNHLNVTFYPDSKRMSIMANAPYEVEDDAQDASSEGGESAENDTQEGSDEVRSTVEELSTILDEGGEDATTGNGDAQDAGEASEEFKETMDDYEAFFDEYLAFMQDYGKDGSSYSLGDYANMLQQFVEITDELENMDPEDLSEADRAYYYAVMGRILEKLASIS